MNVEIKAKPEVCSQLFNVFAWLNLISKHKGMSEFKIRVNNVDNNFVFDVDFHNDILNDQFQQFKDKYKICLPQDLNPIFFLGEIENPRPSSFGGNR